jgi:hypothetical protein
LTDTTFSVIIKKKKKLIEKENLVNTRFFILTGGEKNMGIMGVVVLIILVVGVTKYGLR